MKHDPRIDSILEDCAKVYGGPNVDDQILTADRNAWRARAIELHKAARAYMQVADAILVRMRYRDDPTYDSAAIELGDLLNDRQSAIGAALVTKHGPWNGHTPECKASPINVGHKLHECDCRLMPSDQPDGVE